MQNKLLRIHLRQSEISHCISLFRYFPDVILLCPEWLFKNFHSFFLMGYLPIIGNLLSFDTGAFYRNLKPVLGNTEGTDFSTRHEFCIG